MLRLARSEDFDRDFRRLSDDLQRRTGRALQRFVTTPELPGLNFEKLRGQAGIYSIRVTKGWRVLLRRERDAEGELYVAFHVGPHDVYRRVR